VEPVRVVPVPAGRTADLPAPLLALMVVCLDLGVDDELDVDGKKEGSLAGAYVGWESAKAVTAALSATLRRVTIDRAVGITSGMLIASEPVSKRSARPDAHLDTALDRSKIYGIFDRRHVTAHTCHQHVLHRPATPSLVHALPDRTAYFETGSQLLCSRAHDVSSRSSIAVSACLSTSAAGRSASITRMRSGSARASSS